jgi:hypothetical protein
MPSTPSAAVFLQRPRAALGIVIVALLLARRDAGTEEGLCHFSVDAGPHPRVDTPVSVALDAAVDPFRPLRLFERRGEERVAVPAQVEPGNPARLWWVLGGETPARAVRRYTLEHGEGGPRPGGVSLELGPSALDVRHGDALVLRYHHAHVPPPAGAPREFIRSGYIHPLLSPGGKTITEDFPADHLHHKGIWLPWTQTVFDGHELDFWNLGKKEGTVEFAGFTGLESGPVYGRVLVRHHFLDLRQDRKRALEESWDLRVFAAGGAQAGYWLFDLASIQSCGSSSPLYLLKYRYGGLGFRGPKEWKDANYRVLTSEGLGKENGHATRGRWCAHSGSIDGRWTTVVILCHPENRRFPEPMRIWAEGGAFFNYAPIQAGDWTFQPGETHTFRYRFFVYEGEIDAARAERSWADFGEPPLVRAELARGAR